MHPIFSRNKVPNKIRVLSVNFSKKMSTENNRPIGENSPNLVTLVFVDTVAALREQRLFKTVLRRSLRDVHISDP
jgi:hypothetical protein